MHQGTGSGRKVKGKGWREDWGWGYFTKNGQELCATVWTACPNGRCALLFLSLSCFLSLSVHSHSFPLCHCTLGSRLGYFLASEFSFLFLEGRGSKCQGCSSGWVVQTTGPLDRPRTCVYVLQGSYVNREPAYQHTLCVCSKLCVFTRLLPF